MIQAMTCALVFTSGAGMSFSGPISTSISVMKRRRQALELASRLSFLGSTITPPLPPPNGMPDDRALPGHPHGERLDLVEADVLVVADAALGRAATQVVLDAIARETPAPSRRPSSPGSGRVSSRRGSRSTRRRPGSRLSRSAAMSNCCCATCHGLMAGAARSVVIGSRILQPVHSPGRDHWWAGP